MEEIKASDALKDSEVLKIYCKPFKVQRQRYGIIYGEPQEEKTWKK